MSQSRIQVSRWRLLVVLAAGTAFLLGSTQARAAKFRWKFKAGETLHYQMEQKTVSTAKAEGQESKTTLTQTIDSGWSVRSVAADGSAEMSQKIDRLRLKIETPFAKFEYDSAEKKDPEGPMAAQFLPMLKAQVGAEFQYKISALGELSNIRVPQSLLAVLNPTSGGGGGMFSEEGLKDMIRESGLTFPATDLAPNQSWKTKSTVNQGPSITIAVDKTYTYQGHDANGDKFALDVKVTPQVAANAGIEIKITSQEGKGTFLFDAEKGRVVKLTVTKKLEAVIKRMNMEVTQSSDESNVMTLLEGKSGGSK